MNWRWGVEARNMTLFSELTHPADWEDGRQMSQNSHLIGVSMPGSFVDQTVQFSRLVISNSLWPHGLQHAKPPENHQLPELTHTHVHRVGKAIQSSHPLSSPSLPFCLSLVYSASTTYEKTCWKVPLGESATCDKPHTNISRETRLCKSQSSTSF